MIIQTGNTTFRSTQSYHVSNLRLQTAEIITASGTVPEASQDYEKTSESDSQPSGFGKSLSDVVDRYRSTQNIKKSTLQERLQKLNEIRNQTINYLLQLLFGDNARTQLPGSQSELAAEPVYSTQTTRYTSYFVHHEDESVSFDAKGSVVTADGRSIDFNIELSMSRSFTEATAEYVDFDQPLLCDPLVINLDAEAADVSDQKFLFDLDMDGEEEEISYLAGGSGFLALDKNEDGIINDGSELFGVSSGNGFSDLAEYDTDKNGWIDEADEIFSKLKIWFKDENGNDRLLSLKDTGVGALCLNSAATHFSLNDASNNTNAVIRRTGLFLYENGETGTMQQLDLAT